MVDVVVVKIVDDGGDVAQLKADLSLVKKLLLIGVVDSFVVVDEGESVVYCCWSLLVIFTFCSLLRLFDVCSSIDLSDIGWI